MVDSILFEDVMGSCLCLCKCVHLVRFVRVKGRNDRHQQSLSNKGEVYRRKRGGKWGVDGEHVEWRHVEMQWQRYFSLDGGVDDVGEGGSGRESTLRSININLGQLTHKAEYSTHPRELWASCSEGRASVAAPLRINYIYLWRPGVSCYCRFFFLICFFFYTALMLAIQPVSLLPLRAATYELYCVLPTFIRLYDGF